MNVTLLTGAAQISGGYKMKPEDKIRCDVEYIKNRSLMNDLKIILATVAFLFNK
jgi:lipopolysaccharide/colanic/teichoic acid biosynthesis glycosyltransferase